MATKTATATPLVQSLEAHPLVQPLYEQQCQLRQRQQRVEARLSEARQRLHQAESGSPEIALPLRAKREAGEQIAGLQEELATICADLMPMAEDLEAAKSMARRELRPQVEQEALAILQEAEQAMAALLTVQGAMQQCHVRAVRLGLGVYLAQCIDAQLPTRLTAVRKKIATLAG